jgi:hypothetical protein
MKISVVEMARQIVDMDDELRYLRAENGRLKKYERKYNELLGESVRHGETMMGNMIQILLTPDVSEAFLRNAKATHFAGEGGA